jgi:hypothetical protein
MLNKLQSLFCKPKYILVYVDTLDDQGNPVSYTNKYSYEVWEKIRDWHAIHIPHNGIMPIY